MKSHEEILKGAVDYLKNEVGPKANEIDMDLGALHSALDGLCKRELMSLRRPAEFGGPGFPEPLFREFQETVARYSGSLAFLQTQHQSATSMIVKCDNEKLKKETLPKMGDGERLIGIGFSQLRRPGPPMLTADKVDGGYLLNGTVPWVTGFSLFHEFVIGATLPDGNAVYGVVPFTDTDREKGSIKFGEVMRLAAMESPQTVVANLENFLLPDEHMTFIKTRDWIMNNDMINITLQGFFAVGCARAGLDQVYAAYERKKSEFILETYEKLTDELDDCSMQMREAQKNVDEELTTDKKLRIRAWAIELAARCAHAGITANSGASNSVKHPAQRVYREALVFTVSAQTSDVMQATLERLTRRSQG